jgi:hypothetical protein
VIVSPGRKFVFVHIPKTGGTSLALALEDRAMRDDVLIGDTPKAKRRRGRLKGLQTRGRLWKHATLADIDGLVSAQDLEAMYCFTIVRNPWDRVVSYYHWLRGQTFDHRSVMLAKSRSFEAFLSDTELQQSLQNSPARSYMLTAQGVERCDLYIRLEAFEEDAKPLFGHLGFDFALPHTNASARAGNYREYYNATTRAVVEVICREDIRRFGYRFDESE